MKIKVNIKATNMDLTPAISRYVYKKLNSIHKFINKNDTGVMCDVEVGRTTHHHRSGDVYRAEINLATEGRTFYASAEEEDLYAAIDKVKDEIKNNLSSYKTKKQTLLKRGGAQVKSILKNLRRPKF